MAHCLRKYFLTFASSMFVWSLAAHAQAPKRILEVNQTPTDIDRSSPNWAANVCGGKTAFTLGGARYEWTPVISGFGQYGSVEAVSGWALNPHVSDTDVPFTHPFGKVDFNYFLLPDSLMDGLLAPNNATITTDPDEKDGQKAKSEADALNLPIGSGGLLGVEQDTDLIPQAYRPRVGMGDRVAIFGRWIIDCGHDNWHSEIHPPLLTAVARPDVAKQMTHVDVIANPYLVDQEFADGGVLDDLAHDLALVYSPLPFIPFIDRVSAQASFLPPVRGTEFFSFRIRAPGPAPSSQHMLHFRMHFTARTGVIVQPFSVDNETVGVIGLFTDQLTVLPVTGSRNWDVTGDELSSLHRVAGYAWEQMVSHTFVGLADPIKAAVLAQGIRGILYDKPVAPDLSSAPVTQGWVAANAWGQNPVTVNNNQPFPLIGWIEVQWSLPPSHIASSVKTGAAKAIDRHLDEIRRSTDSQGRQDVAARTLAISALLAEAAPLADNKVEGEWKYRIQGVPGQPRQGGKLWLRSNGMSIQGAIETPAKRRDVLNGTITEDSRVLRLVRIDSRGDVQRILLTRSGSGFVGAIEGTSRTMEIRRQ